MTLPARAATLKAELARLHDLSSKVAEASDLEYLRQDLSGSVEKLQPQLQQKKLLALENVDFVEPASLASAAGRAAGILERFKAEPKASTLKRGRAWGTLIADLDQAASELSRSTLRGWREYRKTVFSGEPPEAIRARLAHTPSNDRAYEAYKSLYFRLEAAFSAAPTHRSTIHQVRQLAEQLENAALGFDFDVPEDVKSFLEAVQSVNGAPLSLLTPAVQDWLKNNNSFDSYRISAKRQE